MTSNTGNSINSPAQDSVICALVLGFLPENSLSSKIAFQYILGNV